LFGLLSEAFRSKGLTMLTTQFSPWPNFSDEETNAVADTLRSNRVNYWTGEECRSFEREFGAWTGSHKAVAVSNGTLALDLALKALGIGSDDEVIVTPRTFIASISCVITAGATPVFADVDLESGNISPATIAPKITDKTRAIIPVHLAGWPADMEGILALAKPAGIAVIEDCAQAHGATINGKSVGSFGDVGAWSFCQDKIMTTGGEGGMVTTDNEELWSKMWSYKDHGKSWDAVYNRKHPPGYRWLHESFGTNWRMLEMQATIGRIQLKRMAAWKQRRSWIVQQMVAAFSQFSTSMRVPLPEAHMEHAFYRLYAYVRPEGLRPGWSRDRIVQECTTRGVPVFQGSCSEVYLEKAFDDTPWRPAQRLPNAISLGETSLMFLTHPTLTDEEIGIICKTVSDVLGEASV
jgi:dTDP-4-amino-4,6-dideoxygalactose transaminase